MRYSENPIKMGDSYISNSEQEQYLGDMINQEGCAASITATIKERIRKLTSKCHEIIQISESPIMGGLGNSTAPFKLYDATIAERLLTNCAVSCAKKLVCETSCFLTPQKEL